MYQVVHTGPVAVRVVALMVVLGLLALAGRANADGRSISFTLGPQQDSYLITGTGFTPGGVVNVVEMPCPTLPCGAEWVAETIGVAIAPDGTFSALLQGNTHPLYVGQSDHRLIVAVEPPELAGAAGNAFVEVPRHHPGTNGPPGAPVVGTGVASEQWPVNMALVAGLLVLVAGASGLAVARVRASRV